MLRGLEHGADGHLSVPGQAGVVGVQISLGILDSLVYDGQFGTLAMLVGCFIRLFPHGTNTAANCEVVVYVR